MTRKKYLVFERFLVWLFVQVLFGFYDPCNLPSNPGWPLRNYLAYICIRRGLENVHFLCYRETRGFVDLGLSLIGEASISVSPGREAKFFIHIFFPLIANLGCSCIPQVLNHICLGWKTRECVPKVVGWEHNKGNAKPNFISLAKAMDPTRYNVEFVNKCLLMWFRSP